MVDVIVGKNAIGKTKKLLELKKDYTGKGKRVVTNLKHYSMYKDFLDTDRVNLINDVLSNEVCLILVGKVLGVSYSLEEVSDSFMDILRYCCTKTDVLLLDEPEYCLDNREIQLLLDILFELSKIERVIITTHEQLYTNDFTSNVYTIVNDKLVEVN